MDIVTGLSCVLPVDLVEDVDQSIGLDSIGLALAQPQNSPLRLTFHCGVVRNHPLELVLLQLNENMNLCLFFARTLPVFGRY